MLADLHVHTTASDGTDSPEEVVVRAVSAGLGALAIADHDTLDGILPAMEEGQRRGLEVLPAIELGTEFNGQEIHLLGYLIDVACTDFQAELAYFRRTRRERVTRMIGRLNKLGFPITLERVLEIAGPGSVGRPHIARAMVETGRVQSVEEAFNFYIGEGKPGFMPRFKYTPARAVRLVRLAGGVAVLAHPGLAQADDLIQSLIPEGLQGVEVYHPGHTPEAIEHYRRLCEQYGLVATGGSDYHGAESQKHNRLGACTVPCRVVEQIKALAGINNDFKEDRYATGWAFEGTGVRNFQRDGESKKTG
ncbi:MAG: PHP domain-containing protein [Bacillota bacterium]